MNQYSKEILKKLIVLDEKVEKLDGLLIEARREIYDLFWSISEKGKNRKLNLRVH